MDRTGMPDTDDRPPPPWYWLSDGSYREMANLDRMPIHHKALDKKRIKRKKKPSNESRGLVRALTKSCLTRSNSEVEIEPEKRPDTPKYLKETYDYDASSSSSEEETTATEDDKTKKVETPLDMSQKVYLTACARDNITPRKKVVSRLALDNLSARDYLLRPEDISALSYALTVNTCVRVLDLSGNTLGEDGAERLSQMMYENASITELKLCKCMLQLSEVMLLTEMLSENVHLEVLEMAGNNLDDESAKCFAEALKYNRRLKRLNLSGNKFDEQGGKILAKCIETNDSIQDLDISWNHIRRSGAIAWGETIRKNEELHQLNLSWNGFGDDGALAISKSLETNNFIDHLNLSSNRIGYDSCIGLAKALRCNTSLKVLSEVSIAEEIGLSPAASETLKTGFVAASRTIYYNQLQNMAHLSQNPISTIGTLVLLKAIYDNEDSKLASLVLEGIQVTTEVCHIVEEIREINTDFTLIHSGFVISPDLIVIKYSAPKPEKECKAKTGRTKVKTVKA